MDMKRSISMNNETKDDIIAEMKRRKEMLEDAVFAAPLCYSTETMQAQSEILDEFIERFEAAHKRERGGCAKLREAVIGLRDRISMFYKNEWIPYDEWEGANDDANAALAAPPRNCDVYNNESCRMAYHLHGDGLMTMQAFADWLFAPAAEKEGGNNGNE